MAIIIHCMRKILRIYLLHPKIIIIDNNSVLALDRPLIKKNYILTIAIPVLESVMLPG